MEELNELAEESQGSSNLPLSKDNLVDYLIANKDVPYDEDYSIQEKSNGLLSDKDAGLVTSAVSQEYADQAGALNNKMVQELEMANLQSEIDSNQRILELNEQKKQAQNEHENSFFGKLPMGLKAFIPPLLAGDINHAHKQRQLDDQIAKEQFGKEVSSANYSLQQAKESGLNKFDMELASNLGSNFLKQREETTTKRGYKKPDTSKLLTEVYKAEQGAKGKTESYAVPKQIQADTVSSQLDLVGRFDNGKYGAMPQVKGARDAFSLGKVNLENGENAKSITANEMGVTLGTESIDSVVAAMPKAQQAAMPILLSNDGIFTDASLSEAGNVFLETSADPVDFIEASKPEGAWLKETRTLYSQSMQEAIEKLPEQELAYLGGYFQKATGRPIMNAADKQMAINMASSDPKAISDSRIEGILNTINTKQLYQDAATNAKKNTGYSESLIKQFDSYAINNVKQVATQHNRPAINSLVNTNAGNYKAYINKAKADGKPAKLSEAESLLNFAKVVYENNNLQEQDYNLVRTVIGSSDTAGRFMGINKKNDFVTGSMGLKSLTPAVGWNNLGLEITNYQDKIIKGTE